MGSASPFDVRTQYNGTIEIKLGPVIKVVGELDRGVTRHVLTHLTSS